MKDELYPAMVAVVALSLHIMNEPHRAYAEPIQVSYPIDSPKVTEVPTSIPEARDSKESNCDMSPAPVSEHESLPERGYPVEPRHERSLTVGAKK